MTDHNSISDQSPRTGGILIIDDDLDVLESLYDTITIDNPDLLVNTASTWAAAKEQCVKIAPDLALLDIKLGSANGLDLIPELRSIVSDMVCIIMTAHRNTDYTVKALQYGADDFLFKPLQIHDLLKKIELNMSNLRLRRVVIAERKQAKDDIMALNATLEQRVQERTAELEKMRTEAEKANKAKTEFLARMSHELRTPMNAILGFAQLLEIDPDNEMSDHQKISIQQILKAGHNLLELINMVLAFSAIENRPLELHAENFSLNDAARECLDMSASMAHMADVHFSHNLDDSEPFRIRADKNRLRQVLLSILTNGIKHNNPGGSLRLFASIINTNMIRIEITDDGPGIAADKQERLFLPFEKLSDHYEVGGAGVGLAISRKLIEAMHGSITARSEIGKGSSFVIELPAGNE